MGQTLPLSMEPPALPRKRWTRAECARLLDAGIVGEGQFELLHGDIVPKMTQHEPHIYACRKVGTALERIFGVDYVRLAAPIALDDYDEPEPDAAVMTRPYADYLQSGTPPPEDVRLAVEVSVSTLRTDMTTKAWLYAQAGIPEYWVLDVNARRLEVFRQPTPQGYAENILVTENEMISPLAAQEAQVAVSALLP